MKLIKLFSVADALHVEHSRYQAMARVGSAFVRISTTDVARMQDYDRRLQELKAVDLTRLPTLVSRCDHLQQICLLIEDSLCHGMLVGYGELLQRMWNLLHIRRHQVDVLRNLPKPGEEENWDPQEVLWYRRLYPIQPEYGLYAINRGDGTRPRSSSF